MRRQWLPAAADLGALAAGGLLTLSLAPWHAWPAALLGCGLYLGVLQGAGARRAAWRGWLFGAGLFGSGASWVYVSIHDHGGAGVVLAAFLTALFCGGLALLHALFAWCFVRWPRDLPGGVLLGFPSLWVLLEWCRSWLLTGFPWLYAGYAALDTWGAGWAPVIGVFGLSFLVCFSAAALYLCFQGMCFQKMCFQQTYFQYLGRLFVGRAGEGQRPADGGGGTDADISVAGTGAGERRAGMGMGLACIAAAAAPWLIGWGLGGVQWTRPAGDSLTVSVVQANIPQELKWRRDYRAPTLDLYRDMTLPLLDRDIVLWPEAAIPDFYQRAGSFLEPLSARAAERGAALLTGIPFLHRKESFPGETLPEKPLPEKPLPGEALPGETLPEESPGEAPPAQGEPGAEPATSQRKQTGRQPVYDPVYYNSMVALGDGAGVYHKQRLVPFGEYVPLERWLRGLIDFFNLPMSDFSPGAADQPPLRAGDIAVAPFICYEIVYPDLVRRQAIGADLLVTVSNDNWFGRSIGPLQHLQMARMRALENGRQLVRGANNGVSAIIDESGRFLRRGERFRRLTLHGEAQPMAGRTPFSLLGSTPVLFLSLFLLVAALPCAAALKSYRE